jgi:hypothetical protein
MGSQLCVAHIVLLSEIQGIMQFIPWGYETFKQLFMSQKNQVCGALTSAAARRRCWHHKTREASAKNEKLPVLVVEATKKGGNYFLVTPFSCFRLTVTCYQPGF